jgi:hypothetical protein
MTAVQMPTYRIPRNAGKFIVVVARGGLFAAWNRKQGRDSISILVRTKRQAQEICEKLNRGEHNGTITV